MAMMTATDTIRPPRRSLRQVAAIQRRALSRHWSARQWRAPVNLDWAVEEGLHLAVDLTAEP